MTKQGSLFISWITLTLAVLITAYLLPSVIVTGFLAALVTALVLGIINAILRPILILLSLPINILTLGLFTLIINALLVLLAARIVPDFSVAGFWSAFWFAIVLAIINWFLSLIFKS